MPDECANPLLLQWVKEWLDTGKEQNSKGVFTYKKAYDSIKACPITFAHPSEAQALRGLGPKLCDRLSEKLKEHCRQNGLPMPEDPRTKNKKRPSDAQSEPTDDAPSAPAKKVRKTNPKPYVPALRSGAYAIVLALSTLPENSDAGLTKNQTIAIAEAHCNSSFLAPSDPTKTYTAWSSMRTLQDKDLVFVTGGATKRYALTEDGWAVASKMRTAAEMDNKKIMNPNGLMEGGPVPAPVSAVPPQLQVAPVRPVSQDQDDLQPRVQARPCISLDDSEDDLLPVLPNNTRQPVRPHSAQSLPMADAEPLLPEPYPKAPLSRCYTEADFVELMSSSPRLLPAKRSKIVQQGTMIQQEQDRGIEDRKTSRVQLKTDTAPGIGADSTATRQRMAPDHIDTFPSDVRTVLLHPDSYTVELLLDNREVRSKTDRTYLQDGLLAQGIRPTTRALELGDGTWVARVHDPVVLAQLGITRLPSALTSSSTVPPVDPSAEFVLDHVVERKRLDDLIASLKDGRFHEQKFRLRRSGARHVTYLVEEISLQSDVAQRWHSAVRSALASTLVCDQFAVVRTKRLDDSIRWLARTTKALQQFYQGKSLNVLTTTGLDRLEDGAKTRREADARLAALRKHFNKAAHTPNDVSAGHTEELTSATSGVFLSYPAFAARAAKQDGLALRDVYLKMLLCARGISGDKALAVQRRWPTPQALVAAYRGEEEDKENSAPSGSKHGGARPGNIGKQNEVRGLGGSGPAGHASALSDKEHKRRAELLFRTTADLAGRQRIGKAVSARVAAVWGGIPEEE